MQEKAPSASWNLPAGQGRQPGGGPAWKSSDSAASAAHARSSRRPESESVALSAAPSAAPSGARNWPAAHCAQPVTPGEAGASPSFTHCAKSW